MSVRGYITIPLVNLNSNVESEQIGAHLRLERFTAEEKARLWNTWHGPWGQVGLPAINLLEFKLTGSYIPREDMPDDRYAIEAEAWLFLTALRLFRTGDIAAPVNFGVEKDESDPNWPMPTLAYTEGDRPRSDPKLYMLLAAELPEVLNLMDTLRQFRTKRKLKPLETPLRWFHQSYSRGAPEDRVIDLTVVLESTLLWGTRDELSYRLSLRGAALLAQSRDPVQVQALLHTVYGVRSKIVHAGGALSDPGVAKELRSLHPPVDFRDLPVRFEDIVRDVLRAYVRHNAAGESMESIREKLDRRIAEGLRH
jgi:hypothetical protein